MKTGIMTFLGLCAWALPAADYILSGNDPDSPLTNNSFENPGYWVLESDPSVPAAQGPSAGNYYTVPSGKEMHTANDGPLERAFGGDRLTVGGLLLVYFPAGTVFTVDDLVFKDGELRQRRAGESHTLLGNVLVPAGYSWTVRHWDNDGYTGTWNIGSDISGEGTIRLLGRAPLGSRRTFNFSGDNSGYAGKLDFYGKSTIGFKSATSMFSAPAERTEDWLMLNGCTLVFDHDHEVGENGGVFVDDKTDASRISEPGADIAVAAGKSVVFRGPLSGGGVLTKSGDGKLSILGGSPGFTGEIVVEGGEIELGAGGTYDSYTLRPEATHVFSQTSPTVAGTLVTAGGALTVDMAGYDTAETVPLTVDAFSADNSIVRLYCRNYGHLTAGERYPVLAGPDTVVLTAFAGGRLVSGDTLGYGLGVTDSGDGTATVWMSPQERLPRWIMSASDASNSANSFTTKGMWVSASDPSVSAAEPPHGGNIYIVPSGMNIRTPDSDGADHTFGGEILVLRGCIFSKISDNKKLFITNLVVEGGSVAHHMAGRNAVIGGGTVNIPTGHDFTVMHHEANNGARGVWSFDSDLTGGGTLRVRGRVTSNYRNVNFRGDNSGFTGSFDFFGHSSVYFTSADSIPSVPPVPVSDWMRVSGCDVVFQTSAEFGANGGLHIADEQDVNRIVEGEEGGRIDVDAGMTVAFNGPLSGSGTLVKKGAGTLVLAGDNSGFSGEIIVEAGSVRYAGQGGTAETLRIGPGQAVFFTASKSLVAANVVIAGGGLSFDLEGFDAQAPAMLEAGNVEFQAGRAEIVCTGLQSLSPGQPYAIMKAPAPVLATAVSTGVFYPAEHHLYSFLVTADATGTETLSVVPADTGNLRRLFGNMSGGDFKTAAVWGTASSDLQAMAGGFRYIDEGYRLRIENADPMPGDVLYLYGASLVFKKQNTPIDFGPTVLRDKVNVGFSSGGCIELDGDFTLLPSGADGDGTTLFCDGRNNRRPLELHADLSGAGRTSLVGYIPPKADGSPTLYSLLGDNGNYVGPVDVTGQTNFYCAISSETSLGGNPPVFRPDQISFNGGGLYANGSLTLDDANRGIYTSGAGGICGYNNEPGAYYGRNTETVVSNTILERTFIGVMSLSTATAETLFRIDCPIGGDGGVRVAAPGTVALGGSNSYEGGTEVVSGTLKVENGTAVGSGGLFVRPGAFLEIGVDAEKMPYGAELGGPLVLENGASVVVKTPAGPCQRFVVPLFLLPPGNTVDPATVFLDRGALRGYKAAVTARMVAVDGGERQLVEATLVKKGFVLSLR